MKKIKDFIADKLGLFFTYMILFTVSAVLANWFELAKYCFFVIAATGATYVLIAIIYAWIINPIRRCKNKEK